MASRIILPVRGHAGTSKPVANTQARGIDADETMASASVSGLRGREAESDQRSSQVTSPRPGHGLCKEDVRARLRGYLPAEIAAAAVPGLADPGASHLARVMAVPPLGRPATWSPCALNVPTTLLPRATTLTFLETRP